MNRRQTKNETEVLSHFMDVARILAYAADRPAHPCEGIRFADDLRSGDIPQKPPRPHTQKVDNPTGYSQNSMV